MFPKYKEESMRLLLTSGGITNAEIMNAFLELLGKSIEESTVLCVTSASYTFSSGPYMAYEFLTGKTGAPMCNLGFKEIGILEVTALPHIADHILQEQLNHVDAILVNGGDPLFLYHFFNRSNLMSHILEKNILYVGLSAGSMILTPDIGREFVGWHAENHTSKTFGVVDFSIFPHLFYPDFPNNNLDNAKKWAEKIHNPCYAIDDETAFLITDTKFKIISEGKYYKLK